MAFDPLEPLRRGFGYGIPTSSLTAKTVNHGRSNLATHKSAAKRARQSVRKNKVNRQRRSEVRTIEKQVRDLIAKKDKKSAELLLKTFMKTVNKAAHKGVVHARNAARRISRISSAIAHID